MEYTGGPKSVEGVRGGGRVGQRTRRGADMRLGNDKALPERGRRPRGGRRIRRTHVCVCLQCNRAVELWIDTGADRGAATAQPLQG